jgi:hypothetical protein
MVSLAHSSKFSQCVGDLLPAKCRVSRDSSELARLSSREGSQTVIPCVDGVDTALSWGLCEQE